MNRLEDELDAELVKKEDRELEDDDRESKSDEREEELLEEVEEKEEELLSEKKLSLLLPNKELPVVPLVHVFSEQPTSGTMQGASGNIGG